MIDTIKARWEGDRFVKADSIVTSNKMEIFKEAKLTIGLVLGDRSSRSCVLDKASNVIMEHNLPTKPREST